MGLDMYLNRIAKFSDDRKVNEAIHSFISWIRYRKLGTCTFSEWCGNERINDLPDIRTLVHFIEKCNGGDFEEEVAYWRKANAIHGWFVRNVQDGVDDCQRHRPVTKEDLVKLKDLCESVLADHALADSLLPTTGGFFFGTYDYDDIYFEKLEYTVGICEKLINNFDFEHNYLYYETSW